MGQYNSPFPGAQVDDAVSKRHTQNTDTKLDEGGANEVSAAQVKGAVDNSHVQGTDQTLDAGGPNEVTAADAADAVTKAHDQNTDTALDTGGPNEITAATLAELASAERGEQFFQTVLQPVGVNTPPDVLYWPTPYRAIEMDATAVRAGSDATFFDRFGVLQNAGPDTFRRDFDPATGAFRGTLSEPQRGNLLLRSDKIMPVDTSLSLGGFRAGNPIITEESDGWVIESTDLVRTGVSNNASTAGGGPLAVAAGQRVTAYIDVEYVNYPWVSVRLVRTDATGMAGDTLFNIETGTIGAPETGSGNANVVPFMIPLGAKRWRIGMSFDATTRADSLGLNLCDATLPRNAPTEVGAKVKFLRSQFEDNSAFPSSWIKTEATTVTRPADTLTIPQVGDRRRGFVVWEGVPVFDPALSAFTSDQVRQFPFGRESIAQTIQLTSSTRVIARGPTTTTFAEIFALSSLQGRKSRIAYWWDSDANIFGVSVDGVSVVNSATTFSAPPDDAIRFGQTATNRQASSHTDWIYISYQIPPIEQIEALTGALL